jgi:hypothetical protein
VPVTKFPSSVGNRLSVETEAPENRFCTGPDVCWRKDDHEF